jgi:hypothetical protein
MEILADAKDREAARNVVEAFKSKVFPKPSTPKITKYVNRDGKALPACVEWDYFYNKNKDVIGISCLVFS